MQDDAYWQAASASARAVDAICSRAFSMFAPMSELVLKVNIMK